MQKARIIAGISAWLGALLMFFPIFWMGVTSFKTEIEAIGPSLLFAPTLENYADVDARADYLSYALNSVTESLGSSLLAMVLGVPAAYVFAFFPRKHTKGILLWMLSTKMMPPVGILVPMYLLFRNLGLLDTRSGIIILFTLSNLPIVIWMLYSFFKDVPRDVLEAGIMDGANFITQLRYLILPMALPGVISTALLSSILCWNEAFWSLNLSASRAAPLTAFIASFSSPEGLFWAKLSAASVLAVAPILAMGWLAQRQLVNGFTSGAAKSRARGGRDY
jgi:sorbitol/mannitol transport system permease protein